MRRRIIGPTGSQTTYTLVYDAENRLVKVTWGSNSATFKYDGPGSRIKASITVGGTTTTTAYVGNYYELSGSTATKYYFAGAQMVNQRRGTTLNTLFGDHLGSITATEDSGGVNTNQGYYPWGGIRTGTSNALPTDNTFTDQKTIESIGLMFYNARFYDSYLNRWVQPDTDVPESQGVLGLDRYAYVNNSPVNFNDPTGHDVDCASNDTWCQKNVDWEKNQPTAASWPSQPPKPTLLNKVMTKGDVPALIDLIIPSHVGVRIQGELATKLLGGVSGDGGINLVYNRVSNQLVIYSDLTGEGGPGIGFGGSITVGPIVGWGSSNIDDVALGTSFTGSASAAAGGALAGSVSFPTDLHIDPHSGMVPSTIYTGGGFGMAYASLGAGVSGQAGFRLDLSSYIMQQK